MFIPPTKININMSVYKTHDNALVKFLASKQYLPISCFDGENIFVLTPELEKLVKEFSEGVEDG